MIQKDAPIFLNVYIFIKMEAFGSLKAEILSLNYDLAEMKTCDDAFFRQSDILLNHAHILIEEILQLVNHLDHHPYKITINEISAQLKAELNKGRYLLREILFKTYTDGDRVTYNFRLLIQRICILLDNFENYLKNVFSEPLRALLN